MKKSSLSVNYNPAHEEFRKEDFPFYWFARINARHSLALEKILKKIGLDIIRWRVLMVLQEYNNSSITEIAIHVIAKLPTLTKVIYRMKDDGLIDTRPDENDGRLTLVVLTEKGWQAIAKSQEVTQDLFARNFKGFTKAQINKLNIQLEKIFNNLPDF